MRKNEKTLCFSGLLLATVSVSAEIPPSIHVDGEYLTDTHGNKVVLHGVMDTPSPYFNNYRWGNVANDATKKDCIEYFDKLFTAITDSTQGAYCNVFRLHLDPCWTNDPNLPVTGEETGEVQYLAIQREAASYVSVHTLLENHRKGFGPWALCGRTSSRCMSRWYQGERLLSGLFVESVGHRVKQH